MENTELIKVLRCELYGDDECDKSDCPIWSELGCRNGIGNRAAADALEADERLLDQNTERCEALRKQLREAHESYEKHINELTTKCNQLQAEVDNYEKRIAELEAQMPKWVSVDDQLPEESGEYIVYIQMGTSVEVPDFFGSNDLSYVTSMYFKERQKLWLDEDDEAYNADLSLVDTANDYHVTHWMPLPQKLKGEQA